MRWGVAPTYSTPILPLSSPKAVQEMVPRTTAPWSAVKNPCRASARISSARNSSVVARVERQPQRVDPYPPIASPHDFGKSLFVRSGAVLVRGKIDLVLREIELTNGGDTDRRQATQIL